MDIPKVSVYLNRLCIVKKDKNWLYSVIPSILELELI